MERSSPLSGDERRSEIMRLVMARGSISIAEISQRFGVSKMTVHRDLGVLESRGLVRKERGSVTAEPSLLFESNFHYRLHRQPEMKRRLAAAAARMIEPGGVIMLDDSTTVLPLVEAIAGMESLTVITHAQAVVERLEEHHHIEVICAGGTYGRMFRATYGLLCEETLAKVRASVAFLSAPAVSGTAAYHQSQDDVRIKRVMMQSAERRVLVVDHTKFHRTALNHLAELTAFDAIFVDDGLDAATIRDLRERGVALEVVPAERAPAAAAAQPVDARLQTTGARLQTTGGRLQTTGERP